MKKESLYDIPSGCICMGDGLLGMPCDAPTHATLKTMSTPSEDISAAILANMLRARTPFYFIKLGDAAVELLNNRTGGTCDGEEYTAALRDALNNAWDRLCMDCSSLYAGDWRTASFNGDADRSRYTLEYAELMEAFRGTYLHFECLLLMRETSELLDFYEAIRSDKRRKLLMGPIAWEPLARLLKCSFIGLPIMPNLFDIHEQIATELKNSIFDILLYGAGTAGHISVIDCWTAHPDRTYINLGSALDPATSRGRTRRQQVAPNRAKAFLEQLEELNITTTGRGDSLLKRYEESNQRARQQNGGLCENGHVRGQRGCVLCEDLL